MLHKTSLDSDCGIVARLAVEDKHLHLTRLSLVWLDVGRGLSSAFRWALQ